MFALSIGCGASIDLEFCPGVSDCSTSSDSGDSVTYTNVFFDDFNRADQPLDDSRWDTITAGGSTIDVDSNEVKTDTNGGAFNPIGFYNVLNSDTISRISIQMNLTGNNFGAAVTDGAFAIFGRSQSVASNANTYICGINEAVALSQELVVFSVVGGAPGVVTRGGTPPLASGDVYTLTLTINGSSLTCSMTQTSGGAFSSSISMTDSNFSNGYHGFGQGKSGAADGEMRMDDFLIEQGS